MTPKLTILVPNYNRPAALARLLRSVFRSIDIADADRAVRVMVVDDFSNETLEEAIAPFRSRPNFNFNLQRERQGNAEAAFLNCLDLIDTDYTWLLGNDDQVMPNSVSTVLRIIRNGEFGMVLLNPSIALNSDNVGLPLSATTPTILYNTCADLFADWGFVTSTTTFPCIIFRTAPMASFHLRHRLDLVAQVYSHSFTLFSALWGEPALYVAAPLVEFNLNHRLDEHEKLQRQSPGYMHAYHQSIGLGRLIRATARHTRRSVAEIGRSTEDELDKDRNRIGQTTLAHFMTFFVLAQLIWEQQNMVGVSQPTRHLDRHEMAELFETVSAFEDAFLSNTLLDAFALHESGVMSARAKVAALSVLQRSLLADARRSLEERPSKAKSTGPCKVLVSDGVLTRLRGCGGDFYGLPL